MQSQNRFLTESHSNGYGAHAGQELNLVYHCSSVTLAKKNYDDPHINCFLSSEDFSINSFNFNSRSFTDIKEPGSTQVLEHTFKLVCARNSRIMEQYILLCLDCHEIFPGRENHSCKRNIKKHLTGKVERVNVQGTRLDGSTISKSSTYENRALTQSAVSSSKEETLPDQMRMTLKPTSQAYIEEDASFRFFTGGDFRDGLFEFEPEKPKGNLNVWPILQDDGYDPYTPREVCTSHFESVRNDLLTDDNVSLASPENMGASAGSSNGWGLIDRCESLDAEAHRRPEDGRFECPVCGKLSNRKANFFAHYRTHTGEKPYSCNVCEKKFNAQENLTTHRRTHTGEKPYSCDMCEKKFSQKYGLDIHRRTHTGERPYPCDMCDHKYSTKSNLERHRKTHMGGKKYK